MDDGWAGFIVLLLRDPHLLEGGEGGQNGSTDPDGVFALRGSDDLDLHGWWGKVGDVLLHTVSDAWVHGGATGQDAVGVQVLTDVNITLHDRVVGGLSQANSFHTQEGRLEESLWATETLVSDGDDLSVGKLVRLLQGGGGGGGVHFLLKVQSDIAKLFLDVTDNFPLGGGGERVTTFGQDLLQVLGKITAGQIQTKDSVGEGVTYKR